MNLVIRSLFLVFCFTIGCHCSAQENTEQETDATTDIKDDHYGIISVGYYQPIAFGDNFVNEALTQQAGIDASFVFNLFDSDVLLGLKYSLCGGEVTDKRLVGNYDNTTISYLGLLLGYHLVMQKHWRAHAVLGFGSATYNNINPNDSFRDSGFSFVIEPNIAYHFNKYFGVYFSTAYRTDRLKIQTQDSFSQYFKAANYLNLNLGIRFVI